MVEINKCRCSAFGGDVRKASPLSLENTQEFCDVVSMARFKLMTSLDYINRPFLNRANNINNLWLSEGSQVPNFVERFVASWSSDDYTVFCEQVKQWALDHDDDPLRELRRRVHALIIRDKQAYQRGIVRGFLDKAAKNKRILFDQQSNIAQLCNEVGEKDDVIFVNDKDFEHSSTQFEQLKGLSYAMRCHATYLLNHRLTQRRFVMVNAEKQATMITKPIPKRVKPIKKMDKSKDDQIELG